MIIEVYRKKNGEFYYQCQKKYNQKAEQRWLKALANSMGQTLSPKGFHSPLGFLYLLSVLGNFRLSDEASPNLQQRGKGSSPAFEIDTFIEVRNQEEFLTVQSFVSTSTSNRVHFQAETGNNTIVGPIIEGNSNNPPMMYLAEKAHQWSIHIHQAIHGISKLENCTTNSEFTYRLHWGLWEVPNHTQSHFKTICQRAIINSQERLGQQTYRPIDIRKFYFKKTSTENDLPFSIGKDMTETLKTVFQFHMEDLYSSTNKSFSENAIEGAVANVEEFPIGKIDLFPIFFSGFLNSIFTEKQENANGYLVIDYFPPFFKQTFPPYYETKNSETTQVRKNIRHPIQHFFSYLFQLTKHLDNSSIVKEQFNMVWTLMEKATESVDRFLERWDPLRVRGAEAATIPVKLSEGRKKILPLDRSVNIPLKSYEDFSDHTLKKIESTISSYMKNELSSEQIVESLRPVWFDLAVFSKRDETESVNKVIIERVCQYDKELCLSNDSSLRKLFLAIQYWGNRGNTNQDILDKRKQIARIILKAYDLSEEHLTDSRAIEVFLQWRNNNIFKNVTFSINKNFTLMKNQTILMDTQMNQDKATMNATEFTLLSKVTEAIAANCFPAIDQDQPLPIFYYNELLFLRRNATKTVNKHLKDWYIKQGLLSDSVTDTELIKRLQDWIGINEKNEVSVISEKLATLAFFLLKTYGVENVRLGDILSATQLQAIFMQWKTNTILEGNTYKNQTNQTHIYQLAQPETSVMSHFLEKRKHSDQLYADFINDRPLSISNKQPILLVCYHFALFENRTKTSKVNEAVRTFLHEQNAHFINSSTSELVRKLREWTLSADTYDLIIKREKEVANLLLKNYGMKETFITIDEARKIFLQWENNNAQKGYFYKEFRESERRFVGVITEEIEGEKETKGKIEAFLNENHIDPAKQVTNELQNHFENGIDFTQKEQINQRIATFLTTEGIPCDISDLRLLVEKVSEWTLLEDPTQETIDMVKVKQIARLITGEEQDGVISDMEAKMTFIVWLSQTIEDVTSLNENRTSSIVEQSTSSNSSVPLADIPTDKRDILGNIISLKTTSDGDQWREGRVMEQVKRFFYNKGLLANEATKEDLFGVMGKWLVRSGDKRVIIHENLQAIAMIILKELNLYGGELEEKISDNLAEATVSKWAVENLLESSIEAYIAKSILASSDPSSYTIGQLRKLFELEKLKKSGLIDTPPRAHTLADSRKQEEDQANLKSLWIRLVDRVLPNYLLEASNLSDDLPISDYDTLMQLTGSMLLKDAGYLKQFNQTEIRAFGEFFCETVSEQGVDSLNQLQYLITPALLAIAQLDPKGLSEALEKGNHKEFALSTFIGYRQKGYFKILELHKTIHASYQMYEKAFREWRRKQALAKEVAEQCRQKGVKDVRGFDQIYLKGKNPCPKLLDLPNINEKYTHLTKAVSNAYHSFNKKLIELALKIVIPEELSFIFSADTKIYEASAQLKNEAPYVGGGAGAPGMLPVSFTKRVDWLDTILKLENTNLFVAVCKNEERFYALKALDEDGGYMLYRVDTDPLLYLKYGLFDQKYIWNQGFQKERDGVLINKKHYTFTVKVHRDKELSRGTDVETFVENISSKHRDTFYRQLYESGNDKATTEKIWDMVKHIIPFYDCVVSSINGQVGEAVSSCLIDVVLLIPLFGTVTALNTKFVVGVARAIARGGLRNAIMNSAHVIPNPAELRALIAGVARYIDPGFESVVGGSQLVIKGLVTLKNKNFLNHSIKEILLKLEKLQKETTDWSNLYIRTHLPRNGPEVQVKWVKNKLYMKVTDLKNGEVSGKYFTLRGNQLREFEGAASFTPEQKALIDRLTKKVDKDVPFVEEANVYPKGYGEGIVYTIENKDKSLSYGIKMNDQIIPIRIEPVEGHGVRYDVIDGNEIFPVNFNGVEWYFEPGTSPLLSKEVTTVVDSQINRFEVLLDPTGLSAPNAYGLMSDAAGRTFIKITHRYIPLILLDMEENRYHLVKKNILEPLTVLRFDSSIQHFRFETHLERVSVDHMSAVSKTGGEHEKASTSKAGIASTSQEETSKNSIFPPYNTIPAVAGKISEWNKFRQAVVTPNDYQIPRYEDNDVALTPLSSFISEPQNYYIQDQALVESALSRTINDLLTKKVSQHQVIPEEEGLGEAISKAIDDLLDAGPSNVPVVATSDLTELEEWVETSFPNEDVTLNQPLEPLFTDEDLEIMKGWVEESIAQNIEEVVPNLVPEQPGNPNEGEIEFVKENELTSQIEEEGPTNFRADYRVFVGFDATKVPDFLKPFIEELSQEFYKAVENFSKAKEICTNLLKHSTIAETKVGKYLIQMFDLAEATNQEQVLREIVKRVLSIAEKGELFLRQSADWGFENMWIVSSDLVRDEITQNYYSQYNEYLNAYAFVFKQDGECRIIIMADAFHLKPAISPGEQLKTAPEETIMHEATHLASSTDDIIAYSLPEKGTRRSGKDLRDEFLRYYPSFVLSESFEGFVKRLALEEKKPNLSKNTVVEALKVDSMLRSNFQLMDAEMVMVIIRDIAQGNEFDIRPRFKRSADHSKLGNGFMFMFQVMMHLWNYENLEKKVTLKERPKERPKETTTENVLTTPSQNSDKKSFATLVNRGKIISKIKNSMYTGKQFKQQLRSELNI